MIRGIMGKAKNETISAWKKINTRRYIFYVNRKEEDVIEWIDSHPKRQQYFVGLIKADMEKNAKNTKGRTPEDDDQGTL